jgi:hypothetical protein
MIRNIRLAERVHAYRGTKEVVFGTHQVKKREYIVTHFRGDDSSPGPTLMERGADQGGRGRGERGAEGRPRRWVEWGSRHDYWLRDADRLLTNYTIERDGPREVAGRTGSRYVVRSRLADEKRPTLELVVDDETGLLLSYRQVNWQGSATLTSSFTTLVIDPDVMPERPVRDVKAGAEAATTDASSAPSFSLLTPQFLPAGFRARGEGRRSGRNGTGWKTIYSDGLTWFEIRQWPAKEGAEEGVLKRSVRGSHVWMRMTHAGVSISLYGGLAPEELERVVRSLKPRN